MPVSFFGGQAKKGYDWWWHSFTGRHAVTGEEKAFFIEFFVCNPAHGGDAPHLGQLRDIPSYLMVKAGAWGEDGGQLHRFFGWNEAKGQIIWHVEQKTWRNRMVTDITCEKKDMLLVNYESPDGKKRHTRLWNGGNGVGTVKLYRGGKLVDEVIAKNVGCEYGEYDAVGVYE